MHNSFVLTRRHQQGFTLMEVLVAVIVLAIGLLGLAGLQATGLKSNHSAYLRSQATHLAYDVADRMRANRTAARSGDYDIDLGDTASGSTMAATDLIAWKNSVTQLLPSGDGSVAVADDIAVIIIQWDDTRAGGSATEQFRMDTQI